MGKEGRRRRDERKEGVKDEVRKQMILPETQSNQRMCLGS
jgi:hypothetical protein